VLKSFGASDEFLWGRLSACGPDFYPVLRPQAGVLVAALLQSGAGASALFTDLFLLPNPHTPKHFFPSSRTSKGHFKGHRAIMKSSQGVFGMGWAGFVFQHEFHCGAGSFAGQSMQFKPNYQLCLQQNYQFLAARISAIRCSGASK